MINRRRIALLWFGALLIPVKILGQSTSQDPPDSESGLQSIEEIVVSAERRDRSLYETPASISVISAVRLIETATHSTLELADNVPGLLISNNTLYAQPYIRGVGSDLLTIGAEASVAVFVDSVYQTRPVGALQDFLDVSHVEVLKGPQGTLFGRNAVGGTLHVISNSPAEQNGFDLRLNVGNYDAIRSEAVVNLVDSADLWRLRAAALVTSRTGYAKDFFGGSDLEGEDVIAIRAKFQLNPKDEITILLTADYKEDIGSRGLGFKLFPPLDESLAVVLGGTVPDGPREVLFDHPVFHSLESWGANALVDWQVGQTMVKNITSLRRNDFNSSLEIDGTEISVISNDPTETTRTLTEELQFSRDFDNWDWIGGLYLLWEDAKQTIDIQVPVLPLRDRSQSEITTKSIAAYADASLQITDKLRAAFGLRYSLDERDYRLSQTISGLPAAEFSANENWSALTPRLVLEWHPIEGDSDGPNDELMVYLNVSRGYKAGGFNTIVPQQAPFNSEFLIAYELGARSIFPNEESNLHMSFYYYDYDDIQLQIIPPGSLVPFAPVQNAGTATAQGFEIDWDIRYYDYALNMTASWLRATFDHLISVDFNDPTANPDQSGNWLPRSPDFSASLRASKEWQLGTNGTLITGINFGYQDRVFYTVFEDPLVGEDSFNVWGAWLKWSSAKNRFDATVYGRNLGDSVYSHGAFRTRNQAGLIKALTAPRTYGVEIGLHF